MIADLNLTPVARKLARIYGEDADDIEQQMYLWMLEFPQITTGNTESYVRQNLYWRAQNWLSRGAGSREIATDLLPDTPTNPWPGVEERLSRHAAVRAAVAALGDVAREIAQGLMEGHTQADIARARGVSRSAINQQVRKRIAPALAGI